MCNEEDGRFRSYVFFFFPALYLGEDPLVGLKFTSYTGYAYSTHGLLLELAQNTRAQKQSQIPSPTVSKVLSLWYTCCLSVTWVWGVWLYWIRAHSIWTGLDCQGFLNPSIFQGHYHSVPVGHISKNVRGCVPFGQGSKHVERGGPFPQELLGELKQTQCAREEQHEKEKNLWWSTLASEGNSALFFLKQLW